MTRDQLEQLTAWARRLQAESPVEEARAAARAILLLAGELERLRAATGSHDDEPGPPSAGQPLADPLRSQAPRRGDDDERERPLREARAGPSPGVADPAPAPHHPIAQNRRARREEERARRTVARRRLAAALVGGGALLTGAYAGAAKVATPQFEAHASADGSVGAAELSKLAFWATADGETLDRLRWTLDGSNVTRRTTRAGDRVVYDGRHLPDGPHTLTVSAAGPLPGADAKTVWRFTVDTTPPTVHLSRRAVLKGRPVRLVIRAEPGSTVTVGGRRLLVENGRFTIAYATPPRLPLRLVATDAAGNVSRRAVRISLLPRRPPAPVRAVHVTAAAWASPPLRHGVLKLLEEGRINAVELDLKDEAGIVGFDADVPFGRRIGAVRGIYDLEKAVRLLHARGAWVIGRLVAFRDPVHAHAAWQAGRRDEVVQTSSGGPYAGYGGFTNFAHPAVRRYNIAVARAAASAGVDDVLYDYVRRPDGPPSSMVFAGLPGKPEAAIVRFLRETARALPRDVFLGASVFGVAATRPEEVAQDIPAMAREVDYIAPMLYPSHWGAGEYGVANPNAEPYDIVRRSLVDFRRQTRGTGARVVPWLQDFSLGVTYGPAEVRAQIRAARDVGIVEFLLWDPLVSYTAQALDRDAARMPGAARAKTPVRSRSLGMESNKDLK